MPQRATTDQTDAARMMPKCDHCQLPATHRTAWRTDYMAAPAYWYDCAAHFLDTERHMATRKGQIHYHSVVLPATTPELVPL